MQKLLEPQIKAMLIDKLLKSGKIKNNDVIINEFTVDGASRRADLVIISNKNLEAFEIKSEADSLSRLEGQTTKYLEYFDKVTVISAEKHSHQIGELLDERIGLWTITKKRIKIKKRGRKSIIKNKQKILNLRTILERKRLATATGAKPLSQKRKDLELALSNTPIHTLRNTALKAIKKRYESSYTIFSNNTAGRTVCTDDLKLLSLNREKKAQEKKEPSIENLILSIDSITFNH